MSKYLTWSAFARAHHEIETGGASGPFSMGTNERRNTYWRQKPGKCEREQCRKNAGKSGKEKEEKTEYGKGDRQKEDRTRMEGRKERK